VPGSNEHISASTFPDPDPGYRLFPVETGAGETYLGHDMVRPRLGLVLTDCLTLASSAFAL